MTEIPHEHGLLNKCHSPNFEDSESNNAQVYIPNFYIYPLDSLLEVLPPKLGSSFGFWVLYVLKTYGSQVVIKVLHSAIAQTLPSNSKIVIECILVVVVVLSSTVRYIPRNLDAQIASDLKSNPRAIINPTR